MKLWSKGLGTRELTMDFRPSKVGWQNNTCTITGTIRVPVVWDYRISFEDYVVLGLLKLAVSPGFLRFFIKGLFKCLCMRRAASGAPGAKISPQR